MREKIMFLPWVDTSSSSSERTPQLLRQLSQWYDVVSVQPGPLNKSVYDQKISNIARYVLFIIDELDIFFRSLRIARNEKVSLIFAEGTYFSLIGALIARIRDIPMVWDNHANIRDFSTALGKSGWFYRGNLLLERILHQLSSTILVVSEKEREAYRELGFPPDKFKVIPTCVDLDALDQEMMSRNESHEVLGINGKVILFFGTLNYEPNMESALYISQEMAPSVIERVPDATIYLAGSGELGEAPGENVILLGFVPKLTTWLSAADVCVAPTWRGVGIFTKVIDMLAANRATVVTPLALDGIPELEDEVNCLIGNDPEHFSNQVSRLLEDDALRERLGKNGGLLIKKKYCWSIIGTQLQDLLDDLMENTRHG